jgi:hypothetical protein
VGRGSGSGMMRGDRRRNARRERLRAVLPRDGAVIGIDLAEDKQADNHTGQEGHRRKPPLTSLPILQTWPGIQSCAGPAVPAPDRVWC